MMGILLALVVFAGTPHVPELCSLRVLIEPGGSFAVVPWGYTADCSTVAWTGSARWVPPGDEVLFRLHPTRRHPSVEPIVDVLGWIDPYPTGEFWQYAGLADVGPREQWLTAGEYFDLILALPDAVPPGAADRTFRNAVERAFARSERWRSTFPGSTILNGYRGR